MKEYEKGILLRIFIDEHSRWATVLRGIMGYGAGSAIHTTRVLRLSEDLPLIIEIVDSREKVNLLLPYLDEHVSDGLITMEEISVIKYHHDRKKD